MAAVALEALSPRSLRARLLRPFRFHDAPSPILACLPTAHKHQKQDALQPCDTEYPVFVHQRAIQEANGIIECGACPK